MEITPQTTAAILPHLTHRFAPCSAYAFGARQPVTPGGSLPHVYVLVLTGRPSHHDPVSVADEILRHTGIGVTLLVHRPEHLHVKSACQRWFFHNVLKDGHRLCLDTGRVPYVPGDVPVRDVEKVKSYWLKCEAVAAQYIGAADSGSLEVELVKVAMLHTAAEFVALGLVRVFTGYTPNRFSLRFLLELCGRFTGLAAEVFPCGDEAGLRRYRMLCAPPAMLRHWDRLEAPEEDFVAVEEACTEFLRRAGELADIEIRRLTEICKP